MHEALVHAQAQPQAFFRQEHRVRMERGRGIGGAALIITWVLNRQTIIRCSGNPTAQQEEHAREATLLGKEIRGKGRPLTAGTIGTSPSATQ